jgi:hypothetical protein
VSFLGRGVAGRLSQTVLNALKDYLLNCIVTCDVKVKPRFLAIAAAWRPIPLLARSLSLRRYRVFKLPVAGALDFDTPAFAIQNLEVDYRRADGKFVAGFT